MYKEKFKNIEIGAINIIADFNSLLSIGVPVDYLYWNINSTKNKIYIEPLGKGSNITDRRIDKVGQDFIRNAVCKILNLADDVLFLEDGYVLLKIKEYGMNGFCKIAPSMLNNSINYLLRLLKAIVYNPNCLLFVEKIGFGLSPILKAKIAHVLVLAHRIFNIHFVLECHNEYLIREFQILVADRKNTYHLTTQDIMICILSKDTYSKKVNLEKIKIKPNGQLSAPLNKGFMSQSYDQDFYLMNYSTTQQIDLMKLKNKNT